MCMINFENNIGRSYTSAMGYVVLSFKIAVNLKVSYLTDFYGYKSLIIIFFNY